MVLANAIFYKNQYNIVSGLKRYRENINQEIALSLQKQGRSTDLMMARQKHKVYETLVSMVIHEGVEDTIQVALRQYAKIPQIYDKETIKAFQHALEAFFLLADVHPHVQQLYDQQRPVTVNTIY